MRSGASAQGFVLPAASLRRDILVPRYYDPRIERDLAALESDYHLGTLDELVAKKHVRHDHGKYVPKIMYGSGPYPYIRTSDLANWELKASPKHGVSLDVYEKYHPKQDVRPNDILFVHEGTYLIGSAAMVTSFDGPLLFQHHLARFRTNDTAPFSAHFLLASLESPVVQRQIRARQFSADIIDSVVGRLGEVVIPIPKDEARVQEIGSKMANAINGRAVAKEQITNYVRSLDSALRGPLSLHLQAAAEWRPEGTSRRESVAFLGGRRPFLAYALDASTLRRSVLLPKYYDPTVAVEAKEFAEQCDLTSIGDLLHAGLLTERTGDEIGKLAYGTGDIAFVRTSDFGSWEVKREPKQGISASIYNQFRKSQDAQAGDILLVRDGTYLVGTSVMLFENDLPLLFSGGIIRYRCTDHDALPNGLFLALMNLPFVRRQLRNMQFTRDVIDTLGRRVREVLLPVPRERQARQLIDSTMKALLSERNEFRSQLNQVVESLP